MFFYHSTQFPNPREPLSYYDTCNSLSLLGWRHFRGFWCSSFQLHWPSESYLSLSLNKQHFWCSCLNILQTSYCKRILFRWFPGHTFQILNQIWILVDSRSLKFSFEDTWSLSLSLLPNLDLLFQRTLKFLSGFSHLLLC